MPLKLFRKSHLFAHFLDALLPNLPPPQGDYIKYPSNNSKKGSRPAQHRTSSSCGKLLSTWYSMKTPDQRLPRIPSLELKTARELEKDKEYLFSAFHDDSVVRIDLMHDEDLLSIFNVDTVMQHTGYRSSRITGIGVPTILGLAPSLKVYHKLWRFRYTLEIQLPYLWGEFQTRFSWAGLKDQAIRTASLDDEVKVIRELWCLLRLTQKVLSDVLLRNPRDCRGCRDFIRDELVSLGSDIKVYKEKLRAILVLLVEGNCHRQAPGAEEWEIYRKKGTGVDVGSLETDWNSDGYWALDSSETLYRVI